MKYWSMPSVASVRPAGRTDDLEVDHIVPKREEWCKRERLFLSQSIYLE